MFECVCKKPNSLRFICSETSEVKNWLFLHLVKQILFSNLAKFQAVIIRQFCKISQRCRGVLIFFHWVKFDYFLLERILDKWVFQYERKPERAIKRRSADSISGFLGAKVVENRLGQMHLVG